MVKQCVYYEISRTQRQAEVNAGLGLEGTAGYEKVGCYDCEGINIDCSNYFNNDMIKNIFKRLKND